MFYLGAEGEELAWCEGLLGRFKEVTAEHENKELYTKELDNL